MTENDFTIEIENFLQEQNYRIRFEVPNMGQSIDILASKSRWLTAIEAKIANWRRALSQCKTHELIADYICIAIATKKVSEELQTETRKRGYGLIHFDREHQKCTWIVNPERNQKVWQAQRRKFSRNLRGIEYV